ncbi:MAG: hypothetical protein JW797_03465 [Bradymonadales bacterium]|nr:hypothetical protein [Bradymonadales bacterium]
MRKTLRWSRVVLSCALFSGFLAAGCTESGEGTPDDSELLDQEWDTDQVMSALSTGAHDRDSLGEGMPTFKPRFLHRVAMRFAQLPGEIAQPVGPAGSSVVQDLNGTPSAFVETFARQADGQLRPAEIAQHLNSTGRAFSNAIDQNRGLALNIIEDITMCDTYLTVAVGARPTTPTLIFRSTGLPPQVFRTVGRIQVSRALDVGLRDVIAVRPFYQPHMPVGLDWGLLYRVGEGADLNPTHLFLVPSSAFPFGKVMSIEEYRSVRQQLRESTLAAPREQTLYADLPDGAADPRIESQQIERWGRVAARAEYAEPGDLCPGCDPATNDTMERVRSDTIGDLIDSGILHGDDQTCGNCTYYYPDGEEVSVESCDSAGDACCEWVDRAYVDTGDCIERCTCVCHQEYTRTERYGQFIRGVPKLHQYDYDDPECPDAPVAVGCGPVAAAELLAWWDQLGWNLIGDSYRGGAGALRWHVLVEQLRNDYLDSWCDADDGQTGTWASAITSGIPVFMEDRGYDIDAIGLTVEQQKADASNEEELFEDIRSAINHSRPVLLGYCCDCGDLAGLGNANHAGIIVGYYTQDWVPYVYINTGWKSKGYQLMEWTIPDGSAVVYFAQIDQIPSGDRWCSADDLSSYYTPYDTYLDYTCSDSQYDSYPVMRDIVGEVCDRIAWDVEVTYTFEWQDNVNCLTPREVDRIEDSIREIEERMSDTPCEEDEMGNPVCPE